jgi:hypothetical protein
MDEKAPITPVDSAPASPAPRSGLKASINEKLAKHSHDADAAMKAFEGMEGQVVELTEEKRRKLLRKIDLHLMPVRPLLPIPHNEIKALGLMIWVVDYVYCLRIELSRQNDVELCQCYGVEAATFQQ